MLRTPASAQKPIGRIRKHTASRPLQRSQPLCTGFAARVSAWQHNYGNQAILRMLDRSQPAPKTKLPVNRPGDAYEQEAERTAEQVMRIHDAARPQTTRATRPSEEKLQRECANCETGGEEDKLQRVKAAAGPAAVPPIVHDVLSSSGHPLDADVRAFVEPRFGYDFSRVRVHTSQTAAASAKAVKALAYTVGSDVVFGPGQYRPDTPSGRRLLAHELTHVAQQAGTQPTLQAKVDSEADVDTPPPGFACGLSEMADKKFDTSKSCCAPDIMSQLGMMLDKSREALRTAIDRLEAGAAVNDLLTKHFGPAGPSQRSTILENIRTTLRVADAFLKDHTFLCRTPATKGCDNGEDARSSENSDIIICLSGTIDFAWTQILHELFHVSGIAKLPEYSKATAKQRDEGEFETYSRDLKTYKGPEFERYPSSMPLKNADSYAKLVAAVSAPDFTDQAKPAARFVPTFAGGLSAVVPGWQPAIVARLAYTPFGDRVLHFITPGAVGVWMPKLGAVRPTAPDATQPHGYVGGELGLGVVTGPQPISAVVDLAAGVGAVWTRGGAVDFGAMLRLKGGLRVGTPAFGASLNADLAQIYDFALRQQRNDIILGLSGGLHWGGSSDTPR